MRMDTFELDVIAVDKTFYTGPVPPDNRDGSGRTYRHHGTS